MVVPCFNEEKRIKLNYWNDLTDIPNVSWIFVNDGSTDCTKNVLYKITNATIIDINKNVGKAESIRKGITETCKKNSGESFWVGYLDADSAFEIEDIRKVIELVYSKSSAYDSYWGSRVALAGRKITRNNLRHILSRILITIFGYKMRDLPYDPQTGFKIFKFNNQQMEIFEKRFETKWFVDLEILIRYQVLEKQIMKIWEEPVNTWKDVDGSNIRGFELITVVKDLIKILRIIRKMRSV
jgi:cellulose synthase/poly-beta-1,6-N-acetylglucosamine synthase-like glycosyltransferase